jgi:hypothetical protein
VNLPAGSEEIRYPVLGVQIVNAILIFFIEKNILFGRLLKLLRLSGFRASFLNFKLHTFFITSSWYNRKAGKKDFIQVIKISKLL